MRIFVILDYEKGSPTKGTFDFVDVRDDGIYNLTTPSGERHQLLLVDFHFELLYEIGSNALLDGYYREAVTSFAAALERFYESFAQFYFAVRNPDKFDWDAFWRNLRNQSERQLGAFCVAYCSLFDYSIPLLKPKDVEFRNEVVHKGHIPTREKAIDFGQVVGSLIVSSMRKIFANYEKQFTKFQRDRAQTLGKGHSSAKADRYLVGSTSNVIGLGHRNQWPDPWTLESRLKIVKYLRALRIIHYDHPRAIKDLDEINRRAD